jgi:hypothetical protein
LTGVGIERTESESIAAVADNTPQYGISKQETLNDHEKQQ